MTTPVATLRTTSASASPAADRRCAARAWPAILAPWLLSLALHATAGILFHHFLLVEPVAPPRVATAPSSASSFQLAWEPIHTATLDFSSSIYMASSPELESELLEPEFESQTASELAEEPLALPPAREALMRSHMLDWNAFTEPILPPAPVHIAEAAPATRERSDPAPAPAASDLASDTIPPQYGSNPPPRYPRAAIRRSLEGLVILLVTVSVEGACIGVRVEQSSGHDILDEAALEAVRNWSFVPGRRGKRPVAAAVRVPIRFRLTD